MTVNESTTDEDDWFLLPIVLIGFVGGVYFYGLEFAVITIGVLIGLLLISGVIYSLHSLENHD